MTVTYDNNIPSLTMPERNYFFSRMGMNKVFVEEQSKKIKKDEFFYFMNLSGALSNAV